MEGFWYNKSIEWGYTVLRLLLCLNYGLPFCVQCFVGPFLRHHCRTNCGLLSLSGSRLRLKTRKRCQPEQPPPINPCPITHPQGSGAYQFIFLGFTNSLEVNEARRASTRNSDGNNGRAITVDRRGYFTHASSKARRPFDNASGKS